MNRFDVEISDNLWARARALQAEYFAALARARSYDVKHDLNWPCDMPSSEYPWRPCGSRELCDHVD